MWGEGQCFDLFVRNGIAYIGSGPSLEIIDVSDPLNIQKISKLMLPSVLRGIYLEGEYAYIATDKNGLRIIDISDNFSPVEVGFLETGTTSKEVYVKDSYAYLACQFDGLFIIDVRDPENPVQIEYFNRTSFSVYAYENYVYSTRYYKGLNVINIVDPQNPFEEWYIELTSGGLIDDYGKMEYEVTGRDSFLYVADGDFGFYIIDISDPLDPVITTSLYTNGQANNIALSGNIAYVSTNTQYLYIIDISNPYTPSLINKFELVHGGAELFIENDKLYVITYREILIFDITDKENPVEITDYPQAEVNDVYVKGDTAFLAAGNKGLIVLDISDPEKPEEIVTFSTEQVCRYVYTKDHYVFLGVDFFKLMVLDITNAKSPEIIYKYQEPETYWWDYIYGFYIKDEFLILERMIFDISDPEHPIEVGSIPHDYRDIDFKDNYCFITHDYDMQIYFYANMASRNMVAKLTSEYPAYGICTKGNYLYYSEAVNGIHIIDISSKSNPVEVGTFNLNNETPKTINCVNNYLYLTFDGNYRDGWITILDAADPINLKQVSSYTLGEYKSRTFINNDYILAANNENGLYILKLDLEDQDDEPPENYILRQNYPNPFNGETKIEFELPEESNVILKIYNILGQEIKTVFEGEKEMGNHIFSWQGNDNNGNPIASGVYIYRLSTGNLRQSRKLVLLR